MLLKSDQTRIAIARCGIKIIARDGLHSLSFGGLAKKSNISRQMIHRYFEDKFELFCLCFDLVRKQFAEEAAAVVLLEKDPTKRLRSYVKFTFRWIEKNPDEAVIMLTHFQMSASYQKLKSQNTLYVEGGQLRILQMIQAIRQKAGLNEDLDNAKAVQNMITGGLISVLTENVNAAKTFKLTWNTVVKIISSLIFVVFSSAGSAANGLKYPSTLSPLCERSFFKEGIAKEFFYRSFKFLEDPKMGLTKVSETADPIFIFDEGFYQAVVQRVFTDGSLNLELTSTEMRPGFPEDFLTSAKNIDSWPHDRLGNLYGSSQQEFFDFADFIKFTRLGRFTDAQLHELEVARINSIGKGLKKLTATVKEISQFAITHYGRRDWSDSLLTDLKNDTARRALQTLFIRVYDWQGTKGTLILVQAPFGRRILFKLNEKGEEQVESAVDGRFGHLISTISPQHPFDMFMPVPDVYQRLLDERHFELTNFMPHYTLGLEKHFDIERVSNPSFTYSNGNNFFVRHEDGIVIEPRFYAIERSVHDEVAAKIFLALFSVIEDPQFSPEFNRSARRFVTYSDKPILYTRLGFRRQNQTRMIDGKNFTLLQASGLDLAQKIKEVAKALKDKNAGLLNQLFSKVR